MKTEIQKALEGTRQILLEKIAYLSQDWAITADSQQKFALQKQIQQAKTDLQSLDMSQEADALREQLEGLREKVQHLEKQKTSRHIQTQTYIENIERIKNLNLDQRQKKQDDDK
ncbi:MAG: hypothetical protein JJT94_03520 [Bernardetiaceae bacterium]|nr:hypothetical protein [Bernardetiaceae bacterium]